MDRTSYSLKRILVAFSGGADSSALAVVLHQLGFDVVLGHIDHQMRPNSGLDAAHSVDAAKSWEVPIEVVRVVVRPRTEAEARRQRYAALGDIADRMGCTAIATGHTLDDDAETVAMRLSRGGFALGIPAVRGRIVRPLLDVRRADTYAFCVANGIDFVTDPTNEDPRFTRNRIRKELTETKVLELAELGRRNRLVVGVTPRSRIAQALSERGVEPKGSLLSDIERKVLGHRGIRLSVSKELSVWSEGERLVIGCWSDEVPQLPELHPGKTTLHSPEWGLSFTVNFTMGAGPGVHVAELDREAIGDGPLTIRQWRPGDRFVPLGSTGSKKLQDFFTDVKVLRRDRHRVPILLAGDRIAWVVGHRIDDRFKVRSTTKSVLRLACEM